MTPPLPQRPAASAGPLRTAQGWRHCPRLRRATGRLHPVAGGPQLSARTSCPGPAGTRFSFGLAFSCPGVPYYMFLCVLAGQPTYTYGTPHGTQRDTAGPVGHGPARSRDTAGVVGHGGTGPCPAACPIVFPGQGQFLGVWDTGTPKIGRPIEKKCAGVKGRAMPPYPTAHQGEPEAWPHPMADRPARDLRNARPACDRTTGAATHNAATSVLHRGPVPAPQSFLFLALARHRRALVALSGRVLTCGFVTEGDKATSARQAASVRGDNGGDKLGGTGLPPAWQNVSSPAPCRLSPVVCQVTKGTPKSRVLKPETAACHLTRRQADKPRAPLTKPSRIEPQHRFVAQLHRNRQPVVPPCRSARRVTKSATKFRAVPTVRS